MPESNYLLKLYIIHHNQVGYVCVLVTQSCPTLCDPMDYSLSCSSSHGILQARILQVVMVKEGKKQHYREAVGLRRIHMTMKLKKRRRQRGRNNRNNLIFIQYFINSIFLASPINWSKYFGSIWNLKQAFGGSLWERKSPTCLKKVRIVKQKIKPFVTFI